MAAVIEIKDLVKDYALGDVPVHVLKNISIEIARGDFVAIMGPSGSGKSTLMNILGCLDKPTSGTYLLDGISVGRLSRDELAEIRNKKIGFVFQQFNLLARTSASENVELPLMYTEMAAAERHDRAARRISQASSPAASSSAWRSPVRWSTIRGLSWRTNRRELWIPEPASRFWRFFSG
jgi:putative ABC transport system ATP-binding protein